MYCSHMVCCEGYFTYCRGLGVHTLVPHTNQEISNQCILAKIWHLSTYCFYCMHITIKVKGFVSALWNFDTINVNECPSRDDLSNIIAPNHLWKKNDTNISAWWLSIDGNFHQNRFQVAYLFSGKQFPSPNLLFCSLLKYKEVRYTTMLIMNNS